MSAIRKDRTSSGDDGVCGWSGSLHQQHQHRSSDWTTYFRGDVWDRLLSAQTQQHFAAAADLSGKHWWDKISRFKTSQRCCSGLKCSGSRPRVRAVGRNTVIAVKEYQCVISEGESITVWKIPRLQCVLLVTGRFPIKVFFFLFFSIFSRRNESFCGDFSLVIFDQHSPWQATQSCIYIHLLSKIIWRFFLRWWHQQIVQLNLLLMSEQKIYAHISLQSEENKQNTPKLMPEH